MLLFRRYVFWCPGCFLKISYVFNFQQFSYDAVIYTFLLLSSYLESYLGFIHLLNLCIYTSYQFWKVISISSNTYSALLFLCYLSGAPVDSCDNFPLCTLCLLDSLLHFPDFVSSYFRLDFCQSYLLFYSLFSKSNMLLNSSSEFLISVLYFS